MKNLSLKTTCGFLKASMFLTVVLLTFTATSFASNVIETNFKKIADKTVIGQVIDANSNAAVVGAIVTVKGTKTSSLTDAKGNFTISVSATNAVLVVSSLGYTTKEVAVPTTGNIKISLESTASELSQVVVVGYGTQNKKDVTGSVKNLKAESFNRGIINAPQQLLQGKVAGVNVTSASGEPGAIQGITVRGPGGLRTGSTPLFVVDGLPLDNSSTGGGDPLNFLNAQDIETMDVLKDASATAIYGARGANGVILITTKRGKAGVSNINYSSSIGISNLTNPLPVYTASEFRTQVAKLGVAIDEKNGNTDWQKEITRTAFTQSHNLTMTGGADKMTYYASFGMQKQQGIIKTNV